MSRAPWRRRVARGIIPVLILATLAVAVPASRVRAATLPAGFSESAVFNGLINPTVIRFAQDGRVFVAEKRGVVKVFDSLSDSTPTTFVDLRTNTYNFWDRGLLGMALAPTFPADPSVYVLYAHDADIGGQAPKYGTPNTDNDPCPTPPAPNGDGCVVSGRLSRLTASGNVATGPEEVLIEGWCQQYPSHSIGSLEFGPDGALYVTGGDGASFTFTDFGQDGDPLNPCGDPPGGVGAQLVTPTAEGGALRSQDLRTSGDPVALSGAVLRLDPATGAGMAGNPMIGSPDPNAQRIIAYGTRNPFRMTIRPGTNEVWLGDVGWSTWEEIDRIANVGGPVENFGWPCYEGVGPQPGYDSADLNICENLYAAGSSAVVSPYYTYNHADKVVSGESCPTGSSSISGLAFYQGGDYPATYADALFFTDYSRDCIWVMRAGANGLPDPTNRATFVANALNPVALQIGPGGDLFYADFDGGTIRRVVYNDPSGNQPPTAVISATPASGSAPLNVLLSGTGSTDPDPNTTLTYAWDLDNDGAFDDSSAASLNKSFPNAGVFLVRLKVTDGDGAFGVDTQQILVDATPPNAVIDTPSSSLTWKVGDVINFSGHATDTQQGTLPASALTWTLLMEHCPSNCHSHVIQTFPGVASGSFTAPDHEYPSHLHLQLTATDNTSLTGSDGVDLQPQTVNLTLATNPAGLQVVLGSESHTAPFTATVIKGSTNSISAPSPQLLGGTSYAFQSWSDGGARTHNVVANANATLTATYAVGTGPTIILPSDDARVKEAEPTKNFGSNTALNVRTYTGQQHRSYLKFNVTGLSAPPASVKLRLFNTDPSTDGGSLFDVSDNWTEGSITWNNQPTISGSPVGALGNVTAGTYKEVDLTAYVTGNGTYSLAIKSAVNNLAVYDSSEGANPPQLVVTPAGQGLPSPVAAFSGTPLSGTAPLNVQFTDQSTGSPTSWSWDFENNGSVDATSQNPSHAFSQPGLYSVKLTVANGNGTNSLTKTNYVTVNPPAGVFTLIPVEDARVNQNAPNTNYGTDITLRVRQLDPQSHRSYIKFSVTGLSHAPASVKLRLFVADGTPDGGTVYRVSDAWTEGGINWNNAPPISGTALGSFGSIVGGTWVEISVTTTVTGNGTYTFGIRNNSGNSAIYSSGEGANPPQLVIDPG
jgi:PKD repeat protein/glucose/arabinose dehydrogenase